MKENFDRKRLLACREQRTCMRAALHCKPSRIALSFFLSCNNTNAGADTTHALAVMLRVSLKCCSSLNPATVNCTRIISALAISNAVRKSVHRQRRTFKFM